MKKTSPWIAMSGARYDQHNWFGDWCLKSHFWLPPEATEVQFVRGVRVKDAVYLKTIDNCRAYMVKISGHYDDALNCNEGMLSDFIDWFGKKSDWVYVDWR